MGDAGIETVAAVGPQSPQHDPGMTAGGPSKNDGEPPARFDTTFTPGKIFVGGLASETSEEDLKEYFSVYGALTDVVVMRDKMTGNGRGFGFVTFQDRNVAERVVAQKHEIRGRTVGSAAVLQFRAFFLSSSFCQRGVGALGAPHAQGESGSL